MLQKNYNIVKKIRSLAAAILTVCVIMSACTFDITDTNKSNVDYSDLTNWAFYSQEVQNEKADVFFINPTTFMGSETVNNMPIDNENERNAFVRAINMEMGIYNEESRFFAPYYSQAALKVFKMEIKDREPYFDIAYDDVEKAFDYYIENCNNGRPIILAGFSQGALLCIRLLKNRFNDEKLNSKLVACYAIGWSVTEEEIKEYPHLKFATGESDTGVIVAFNSEAEYITGSIMIPEGTKTLAINPLNWKTDGTVADKSLNLGACFVGSKGQIKNEIPNLTGAYIDSQRGALKVADVSAEEYPPVLDIFENGIYHLYDYQFFYRNLQENVKTRLAAYLGE